MPPDPPEVEGLLVRVRARLAADVVAGPPSPGQVAAALRAEGQVLGDRAVLELVDRMRSELVGAGVLEPLLRDPLVTDVLVNGPGEVWVDRGSGLERADVRLRDEGAVRRLAQRLAAACGRRLDDAAPWVDAPMPDGTRLHAVLAPVSRRGTVLSLRVPGRRAWSLDDYVAAGGATPEGARWLSALVAARLSFLVIGGTGTGKTTLLSALLGLVPPSERVVLVEDTAELRPSHPHVVALQSRPANVEGAGEVTLRDLVRQALRMRPDRLVVGEVRGAEVVDLLAALNTGHEGGCGTVHANGSADLPARIEALGIAAGLSRDAVHAQLGAGVDAVVDLGRDRRGRRSARGVALVEVDGSGRAGVVPALDLADPGADRPGRPRLVERLAGAAP